MVLIVTAVHAVGVTKIPLDMMPLLIVITTMCGYLTPAMNCYGMQLDLLCVAKYAGVVDEELLRRTDEEGRQSGRFFHTCHQLYLFT